MISKHAPAGADPRISPWRVAKPRNPIMLSTKFVELCSTLIIIAQQLSITFSISGDCVGLLLSAAHGFLQKSGEFCDEGAPHCDHSSGTWVCFSFGSGKKCANDTLQPAPADRNCSCEEFVGEFVCDVTE